jgi:hypothetical protein
MDIAILLLEERSHTVTAPRPFFPCPVLAYHVTTFVSKRLPNAGQSCRLYTNPCLQFDADVCKLFMLAH